MAVPVEPAIADLVALANPAPPVAQDIIELKLNSTQNKDKCDIPNPEWK